MYKFLEDSGVHEIIKWYWIVSRSQDSNKSKRRVQIFVWLRQFIKLHVYFNN